ncbi:hypothetical protein MTO96_011790 [Rhipicephalus appendiculatus]
MTVVSSPAVAPDKRAQHTERVQLPAAVLGVAVTAAVGARGTGRRGTEQLEACAVAPRVRSPTRLWARLLVRHLSPPRTSSAFLV